MRGTHRSHILGEEVEVRGKRGMRDKRGKRKTKAGRQSGEGEEAKQQKLGIANSQWLEKAQKSSDYVLEMSGRVSIVLVFTGYRLATNLVDQVNE